MLMYAATSTTDIDPHSSSGRLDRYGQGQDPADGAGQDGSIGGRDDGRDVAVGADYPCLTGLRTEDSGQAAIGGQSSQSDGPHRHSGDPCREGLDGIRGHIIGHQHQEAIASDGAQAGGLGVLWIGDRRIRYDDTRKRWGHLTPRRSTGERTAGARGGQR
jgi:hypothetical protein